MPESVSRAKICSQVLLLNNPITIDDRDKVIFNHLLKSLDKRWGVRKKYKRLLPISLSAKTNRGSGDPAPDAEIRGLVRREHAGVHGRKQLLDIKTDQGSHIVINFSLSSTKFATPKHNTTSTDPRSVGTTLCSAR